MLLESIINLIEMPILTGSVSTEIEIWASLPEEGTVGQNDALHSENNSPHLFL